MKAAKTEWSERQEKRGVPCWGPNEEIPGMWEQEACDVKRKLQGNQVLGWPKSHIFHFHQ